MKRAFALLMALTMAAGLLAGCGSGSSTPAASSAAPAAPAASEAAPASEPAGQPAGGADKIVCGVVLIDMTNQFFVDVYKRQVYDRPFRGDINKRLYQRPSLYRPR